MGWNKYGAKRTVVDGQSFPSKLEADVYCHLKMLEKAGELEELVRQPTVYLTDAKISYKPDFQCSIPRIKTDDGIRIWGTVYIEAKGLETERYRLIKKLWKHYGLYPLHVYKANRKGVYLAEEIIP
jgi:hypothetical protein